VQIPVQVKGKVRAHITVSADADAAAIEAIALADPNVVKAIEGNAVQRVVVVPGRMVNVVT
jgi:leucyl-tRNA synthetase